MSDFLPALLRRPEVTRRTGLSRTTVYRLVQTGEFPAPRQIGRRSVAWVEAEVSAWILSRTAGTRSTGVHAA
jgi:prophage regulatory protein